MTNRVHVGNALFALLDAFAERRVLFGNVVLLRRQELRVAHHVTHGNRVVPAQPAMRQAAELVLLRQLPKRGNQINILALFAQGHEEREARQTRRDRLDRILLAKERLCQPRHGVSAIGGIIQPIRLKTRAEEHLRRAGNGLPQRHDNRFRAGGAHIAAQIQHHFALTERMQQPLNAAVDARLIAQTGVILLHAAKGLLILPEARRRHAVARVNDAVRAHEDFLPIAGNDDLRLAAAGIDDGLGIVLEDIAHGGVFLLHRENAILFAGVEEIDEQEGQVHRNILPDEGELKRHGTAPLSGYFDSLSYHETRQK